MHSKSIVKFKIVGKIIIIILWERRKMDSDFNLESAQQLCRICLKNGDVNIWNCSFLLHQNSEINDHNFIDEPLEKSFVEIISIFFNSEALLNFTEEFPMLCQKCLDDLKFCYCVYEKVKRANVQLISLYQESLNQFIEEEHLIETIEGNEDCKNAVNSIETVEKENMMQYDIENIIELTPNKQSPPKRVTLDSSDSFIVTQFVPEVIATSDSSITRDHQNDEFRPPQNLLTVNLKAVEVQNFENVDRIQPHHTFSSGTIESAIYVCQYCPQAFTKSEYLKTHIQKSHVCKFCTQPFNLTDDLFSHIREVHTENKCAICQKHFSSGTNLRHHIKRVHRINLPAKVTLIDFIKSTTEEENNQNSEKEILGEIETADLDLDTEYLWKSCDCTLMLSESNSEIN